MILLPIANRDTPTIALQGVVWQVARRRHAASAGTRKRRHAQAPTRAGAGIPQTPPRHKRRHPRPSAPQAPEFHDGRHSASAGTPQGPPRHKRRHSATAGIPKAPPRHKRRHARPSAPQAPPRRGSLQAGR